jgi:hypothetical protein
MKKLIILLAAFAMVGAFVATAMADVQLYGSARMRTYYIDKSKEVSFTGYDDTDFTNELGWLSRFGANFKSDKLTGQFELDARPGIHAAYGSEWGNTDQGFGQTDGAAHVGNIRVRHLWGQYDFGAVKLLVGQTWPLYNAPVSGINFFSGGLQEFGGIGYLLARTSQVRLTFGNLAIAFMEPSTRQGGVTGYTTDVDTTLPKVEIRYDLKVDPVTMSFIGGYQTYDGVNATDSTKSINSYVLGFAGETNFGPGYAKLALSYRVNGNNYGAWSHYVDGQTAAQKVSTYETATIENGEVKDATEYGGVIVLGYKVNDMFSVEASYGYIHAELDTALDNKNDAAAFGIMAPIKLAPGVSVTPEFIYQDEKDHTANGVTADDGKVQIYGVFWNISFK